MAGRIAVALIRWAPWAVAAGAFMYTIWALNAQVVTQRQLNAAMQGVKENVAQARELTGETAEALAPLAATADTLEQMNRELESMVSDLQSMNATMGRIMVTQKATATRLDSLNSRMVAVVADLGVVDQKNRSLLGVTQSLSGSTAEQAAAMADLSGLTGNAIGYLSSINRRFAFLQQF